MVLIVLMVVAAPGSAAAQSTQPAEGKANRMSNRALLKQLLKQSRANRKKLEALEGKVEKLSQKIDDTSPDENEADEGADPAPQAGQLDNRANLAKLNKIELPDEPTRRQVRKYVREISQATQGQNVFSSDDPQVRMLTEVGSKHIEVLMNMLGRNPHDSMDYYLIPAIQRLARPEDKRKIIDAMTHTPKLVRVVAARAWEKDAKDELLSALEARNRMLSIKWIKAVARFRDPNTYDDFKWQFIHSDSPAQVYKAIRYLPDIELKNAVQKAWRRARNARQWRRLQMARIAVDYGHASALDELIGALDNKNVRNWINFNGGARGVVLRHIDFAGSNDEIRKWFKHNRDNLQFNEEDGKFYPVTNVS